MIDFRFIEELEGNVCTAYVPNPETSKSGVTIGCGFDLGARDSHELESAFAPELCHKLLPYAGLKKQEAAKALTEAPLVLSEEEVLIINKHSKQQAITRLATLWNKSDATVMFDELPIQCQTAVASVAFQYGDLSKRTPNFWRQVTQGDWTGAIDNLRDFGDKYPTRRNKEAELLSEMNS